MELIRLRKWLLLYSMSGGRLQGQSRSLVLEAPPWGDDAKGDQTYILILSLVLVEILPGCTR